MRPFVFLLLPVWAGLAGEFNYAEALQKSLYFYEAQQSGRPSPNNRVAWRGPACLTDGQDVGHDLSGGWFDAGDHWTANLTMSFAAMTLAWSAVEHPAAYLQTGQMPVLLENLVHVNDYFLRCVLNPECQDPANELEVAIGCGGREGVDDPNVHSMWAPAEVAHLMTRRPTFRLNRSVPGGDIPAAMAAAMAAGSMVIRDHGDQLKSRRGFERFDPVAFADRLLDRAGKLTLFARANAGPVLLETLPDASKARIRKARNQALRADGNVVETGYRSDPWDKIVAAASWLERAGRARPGGVGSRWLSVALEVYDQECQAEQNHDWWKDFGAGNFGKLAAYNLMRLLPDDARFHAELQLYAVRFCTYRQTVGGLRLREWFAHEYGSLRHANNAAVIALHYSDYVGHAPVLPGNTWWKEGRSNEQMRDQFRQAARAQVDYALGENPYHRSYLVGFGQAPFNDVHHRGAYGSWAGFDHFIPGKADDRRTNRHILYGALVAGPDHNDVFLCGTERQPWQALPDGKGMGTFYRFPNRSSAVVKEGYAFDVKDLPVQDVMDSRFNEVALDYNAGITASFAWLLAHGQGRGLALPNTEFPPREPRQLEGPILNTDREVFVVARRLSLAPDGMELEAILENRSRWPARVLQDPGFRIFFTPEPGVDSGRIQVEVAGGGARVSAVECKGGTTECSVRVSFPGVALYPGSADSRRRVVRIRFRAPSWDVGNDRSLSDLTGEMTFMPSMPVDAPSR